MSCERDTDAHRRCVAVRDCQRFGCLVQILSDNREVVLDSGDGWALVGYTNEGQGRSVAGYVDPVPTTLEGLLERGSEDR